MFSDNCTHLLGSSTLTYFAIASLRLSTKTMSANRRVSREMVMVLDEMFPVGSAKRKNWSVTTIDLPKAFATIKAAEIDITDLTRAPSSFIFTS